MIRLNIKNSGRIFGMTMAILNAKGLNSLGITYPGLLAAKT